MTSDSQDRPDCRHKIFGVTGWKNSGKTTLATAIISNLSERGYKVSSVKHAHHECDIDKEETDSFRHRQAGSGEVALVAAGTRWAIMHECRNNEEPRLMDILARLSPCDLVIVEGYKAEPFPKIEVRRMAAANRDPIAPHDPFIKAIASDCPDGDELADGLPHFHLDDIEAICNLIINMLDI
ncbi:molybdopterin-guanine dinucleotide biosynthesis protein B [uncultured Cohaesibacter sp.]|uniref:molybdopterin-guanine dinucleotide biosynthesis protein B n=1 Tax=uncultured Cohaesibacter sp. TaxID=1002546 RepID=UPI00292F69D8|nr:molybdopterin-guanine dinucleotide biosynthesis protein B [uncultured Cohaesibacter sp.]